MAKTEWQKAQDEFEAMIKGRGGFAYRVMDASEMVGRNGGKISRNVRKAPSDFIVSEPAVGSYYAEVKSTSDPTRFKFSMIEGGQLGYCRKILRSGGDYFFIVKSLVLDKWFIADGELVLNLSDNGKGSMKWTDMTTLT